MNTKIAHAVAWLTTLTLTLIARLNDAADQVRADLDAQARMDESRARFRAKWGSVAQQRELDRPRRWPECVSWNTGLRVLVD